MLIIGAGGHAQELLQAMGPLASDAEIYFYDDVTPDVPAELFGRFSVLRNADAARALLARDPAFVLGLGGSTLRWKVAQKFRALGGELQSVVASSAQVGSFGTELGAGLNVMHNTMVANSTRLQEGCLVNTGASIHHDVVLGVYCEVSPGARVLGRCTVGDFCTIGANATILPDVRLGANAVVGAGAVVTRHVAANTVVAGVPARLLR